MNVKGMTIKDIMNIDLDTFNSMNESDLRQVTSRLVSASNKRIRRMLEHQIESPAMISLKGRTSFSTKTPSFLNDEGRLRDLRHTFAETRNFLSLKTSTIKGYQEMKENMKQTMLEKYDVELTGTQLNQIVKVMNRLKRERKIGGRGSDSSQKMFEVLSQRAMYKGGLKTTKDYGLFQKWSDKIYLKSQGADVSIDVIEDETPEFIID